MKSNESVAYLKGIFEGLSIDKTTPEGKLFVALMDTVDTLAHEVAELQEKVKDLGEYIEEIDDDLAIVEDELYEEEFEEDDFDDEEETQFYEVVCPSCGEVVCFDDSLEGDEITCPSCGENLELDFECDGSCCGEDCEGCPASDDKE